MFAHARARESDGIKEAFVTGAAGVRRFRGEAIGAGSREARASKSRSGMEVAEERGGRTRREAKPSVGERR